MYAPTKDSGRQTLSADPVSACHPGTDGQLEQSRWRSARHRMRTARFYFLSNFQGRDCLGVGVTVEKVCPAGATLGRKLRSSGR
jgi:hypothetical protein